MSGGRKFVIYTISQTPNILNNNSAKNKPIIIIFGSQNHEKISHQKIENYMHMFPYEIEDRRFSVGLYDTANESTCWSAIMIDAGRHGRRVQRNLFQWVYGIALV